ncbi:MAG: TetR/AcrR family transcriptional regulator [Azospirillaceae bacterium]|nr:TetR/AcrR family transcriptional regulator [Azospirillaceae bacterium]
MTSPDTKQQILDTARAMVQASGYNALSFREIGKAIGIKSASIHYHFPTKGNLAAALARRYTDDAAGYFAELLASPPDAAAWSRGYIAAFRQALMDDNRMCLYGVMAAEYGDLPPEVRVEVDRFAVVNVEWLTKLLALHLPKAEIDALRAQAQAVFAAIEGAQLMARGKGDVTVFDATIATYRALGIMP